MQGPKKIFFKVLFCGIGITILVYSCGVYFWLNCMPDYMNYEYPQWIATKELSNTNNYADVVLLGDSRCKADFNPIFMKKLSVLNLAIGSGGPDLAYYNIKDWLKYNKKPKAVVISFIPGYMETSGSFYYRTAKFKYLSFDRLVDVLNKYKEYGEFVEPHMKNDWKFTNNFPRYGLVLYYLSINNYYAEMVWGIIDKRWKYYKQIYDDTIHERGHVFYGRDDGFYRAFNDHTGPDVNLTKATLWYFDQIKNMLGEDVKIFFVFAPINESSANKPGLKEYRENIEREIESKFGFIILKKFWVEPDSFFGDDSHIYKGCKTTSLELEKLLLEHI